MKNISIILLLVGVSSAVFSQTNKDYLAWSSTRRLTVNDFEIKTETVKNHPSFAHFVITYNVKGFDFMAKNFNKKISNYMIKSASWIDTSYNVSTSLKYQQTLFDMAEVYTRRFRKELRENRKKIAFGTDFIDKMNSDIMDEFTKRRLVYDSETKFGSDALAQKRWEIDIQMELDTLKEFSDELTSKQ
ncbi:hypothetical protein [Spirosoma sp. 48-14]|uniref:hypothetical protein n=1 Tax=Spirosoma sp. 48-14 TaxID=1895854 RepID=UPI000964BC2D|nr:hypothetical protein [Spirosoma sp. 48-14]OJW76356.1 MAG: hypothetical protein BGO59_22820 [Spirosoma sp. 48-14]